MSAEDLPGIKATNLINSNLLMDQLPQLPPDIDGLVYGDIPNKYIKTGSFQPYTSLNIDAVPSIFYKSLKACSETKESDNDYWTQQLEDIFVPPGKFVGESALITLSVRSTFDLYLQARNFPKGSEIIMTGINIGDMIQIIKDHGLVPIPVDLDLYTMAPSLEQIQAATTPQTKACLFAYLYGITYDIQPYAQYLLNSGIDIIEDCAQSWRGLETFRGSRHATMTMFSFGTIKYNTAFWGSVSIIRSPKSTEQNPDLLVG